MLDDLPLFAPKCSKLEAEFRAFHAANPDIYRTLARLAREWKAAGHRRCSTKLLFERARWEFGISSNDPDFALNNNHTAYYARLLMQQEPDLKGLFETRRQKSTRP